MHEQSLAKALLRQVGEIAQQHTGSRVTEVKLIVGDFSGVEPELLKLAIAREAESGPAFGARVSLHRALLVAHCGDCSREFPVQNYTLQCPMCGLRNVVVVQGEELILESVTLETDA